MALPVTPTTSISSRTTSIYMYLIFRLPLFLIPLDPRLPFPQSEDFFPGPVTTQKVYSSWGCI